MTDGTVSAGPIQEIDVLWINAGLSCDGDTIAMTAATQPSIEDLVLGNLPWIPKVHFHNLFLAYENGDDFLARFHRAAQGKLAPFILVAEGSIPDDLEACWSCSIWSGKIGPESHSGPGDAGPTARKSGRSRTRPNDIGERPCSRLVGGIRIL